MTTEFRFQCISWVTRRSNCLKTWVRLRLLKRRARLVMNGLLKCEGFCILCKVSVKFLAYQRIIIFNLTVTPLACILNLCSWIIGRSSVVRCYYSVYMSLNTINLNNIRSYLKSWLRKQTLVSKGEYSKLLEAFWKIPDLSVAVILGKPLYAFTNSYWTHSRTSQLLCNLLCLCLIAAIRLPDTSAKQPSVWKLRLCFWPVLFNRKPTGEFIPSKDHFNIAHNTRVHNHCLRFAFGYCSRPKRNRW